MPTVSVRYIDVKGKAQGSVTCNKLKPGNENRNMGDGWYAVTEDISYDAGIILFGQANLILCDGATLTDTDGIWVQEKASLTIWAQSEGDKMGKLVASAEKDHNKAAIGGIENQKAGVIIINGGDIDATGKINGAAIGSGQGSKSGFTRIEINGGRVNASQANAAGAALGSGYLNGYNGSIIITGGHNARYCDPGSVIVYAKQVVLKTGGTYRIRASLKGMRKDMNILNITRALRYFSSKNNVASVSETGKIKAMGSGSCTVYILANNGARASIKVTVK